MPEKTSKAGEKAPASRVIKPSKPATRTGPATTRRGVDAARAQRKTEKAALAALNATLLGSS